MNQNSNLIIEELSRLKKLMNINESLINEAENIDDFFNFLERDPKAGTKAHVYYVSTLDAYLSRKTGAHMLGKIFKSTDYPFNFAETYKRAAERKNPDYVAQTRKGEYSKVQGYGVLEFDKAGELVLPIVPNLSGARYFLVVLDENGEFQERIDSMSELKNKYPDIFQPSFHNPTPKPPSSGVDFRPLKVKSIIKIAAGGAVWNNPDFKYGKYASYLLW